MVMEKQWDPLTIFAKQKWRDDRVKGGCKNGGMTGEYNSEIP